LASESRNMSMSSPKAKFRPGTSFMRISFFGVSARGRQRGGFLLNYESHSHALISMMDGSFTPNTPSRQ
jgi:hypothetical protein